MYDAGDFAVARRGNLLAYSQGVFEENIWSLDALGARERVISSTRRDYSPHLSPDGKKLAFTSSRTGVYAIWVSDADGANPEMLFGKEGVAAGSPRWSPDGKRLAYDVRDDTQYDIYVISAAGRRPLRITSDPGDDQLPSWSHDGKWVYFTSGRTGRYEIWKKAVGGETPIQVTSNGGDSAVESPDGETVYYLRGRARMSSLWALPAEGGEERRVLDSVHRRSFTVLDQGVYFVLGPGDEAPESVFRIQFLEFGTGEVTTVAPLPAGVEPMVGLTTAPDGAVILYSQIDGQQRDLMLVENFR